MPTYRKLIKQAWQITFRNKVLWFLGFWVALLGNGGEYEIFFKNFQTVTPDQLSLNNIPGFLTSGFITKTFLINFKNLIISNKPLMSFAVLLVVIALIYLTITAQGTLIDSIYLRIKKKHKINIRKSWIKTRSKFWELLFTNIFFKGGGIIIAFLVCWSITFFLYKIIHLGITLSSVIVATVIFTPLIIITSFLVKYTLLFIITRNLDPLNALVSSVKLFQQNWLITLENALVLFVINLFIGIITLIVVLLVSFPVIAAISLVTYPLALPDGYYVTIIAWLLILIGPILGSILATFQYGTWTILFKKLIGKRKLSSTISHIATESFEKIFK